MTIDQASEVQEQGQNSQDKEPYEYEAEDRLLSLQ
jgi:hypothetical protein